MPALSQERIKLLDEIGMNWGEKRKITPWDARYEALIEYRKRFGHVNVPWQWKEDVALAQWVNGQRKKYKDLMDGKRNNLSDEQINRLNLIGAFAFHKSFVVSFLSFHYSPYIIPLCSIQASNGTVAGKAVIQLTLLRLPAMNLKSLLCLEF